MRSYYKRLVKKNKNHTVQVRLDDETMKRWKFAANLSGLTISAWIRLRVEGVEEIEVPTPSDRKAA